VTRQPSAQIALRPTSAAVADIRSQRTMPSACGGALPASSAFRTEPASVPVSFRPPGCSLTTDLARFAVRSSGFRGRQAGPSQAAPSCVHGRSRGHFPVRKRPQSIPGRVRSCDSASSGACEVRAAISRPRSAGSGLYAPLRGHDQGGARGRWPRGAPVPLARLAG
jgi:hypothetical protein